MLRSRGLQWIFLVRKWRIHLEEQSAGINGKEKSHNLALGKCVSITFLGKRLFCWKKMELFSSIKNVTQIIKICEPFSYIPQAPNHKNL